MTWKLLGKTIFNQFLSNRKKIYLQPISVSSQNQKFLKKYPPRDTGLGLKAIKEQKIKFIPDPSEGHNNKALYKLNPKIYKEGIKAIAAFPLIVEDKEGVLYIHYHREHRFTEGSAGKYRLFVGRLLD